MAGFDISDALFDVFVDRAIDAPSVRNRVEGELPATAMRFAIPNRHRR